MLTGVQIFHNGSDMTDHYLKFISDINLTDEMGLAVDTLDIGLYNANFNLITQFEQGDQLNLILTDGNGRKLNTGTFYIDTISGDIGDSNTITIGSTSSPSDRDGLKKKIRYNRRKVDLQTVLKDVLKRGEMGLVYRLLNGNGDAWKIELKNARHSDQTIGEILASYVQQFHCLIKIHDDKVIFGDKRAFNFDPVVMELTAGVDILEQFSFDLKFRQYTEYDVKYYDPKSGLVVKDKKKASSRIVKQRTRAKNRRVLDEWRHDVLFVNPDGSPAEENGVTEVPTEEERYYKILWRANEDKLYAEAKKAAVTGKFSDSLKEQLTAFGAGGLVPLLEKKAKAPRWKAQFENEVIRSIYDRIGNADEARAIALAVDGQDLFDISFTTTDEARLIAANVIQVNKLENFSGKYLIKSAAHSITSDGWTVSVSATNLF